MEKKRKVSHKGSRAKGASAERELVEILDSLGLPSQRVLGSGAFAFAKSDIKVNIRLNEDGTKPAPDESQGTIRVEVKNHAITDEKLFGEVEVPCDAVLFISTKATQESVFKHLEQDSVSKAVIYRRPKVPVGALKDKDYNRTHCVVMPLLEWVAMFKKANGIKD